MLHIHTMKEKGLSKLQTHGYTETEFVVSVLKFHFSHRIRVNTETSNLPSPGMKDLFSFPMGTGFLTDLGSK